MDSCDEEDDQIDNGVNGDVHDPSINPQANANADPGAFIPALPPLEWERHPCREESIQNHSLSQERQIFKWI